MFIEATYDWLTHTIVTRKSCAKKQKAGEPGGFSIVQETGIPSEKCPVWTNTLTPLDVTHFVE